MSSSPISRKRLKSVAPWMDFSDVVFVILPLIAICPPCRNNPSRFPAHHVHHNDFNMFQKADSQHAVFTITACSPLEYQPVEDAFCVPEIDIMLDQVCQSLALVPLEKHH